MIYYINREEGRYHETVDQFDDKAEALAMKSEYQLSEFGRAYYYCLLYTSDAADE